MDYIIIAAILIIQLVYYTSIFYLIMKKSKNLISINSFKSLLQYLCNKGLTVLYLYLLSILASFAVVIQLIFNNFPSDTINNVIPQTIRLAILLFTPVTSSILTIIFVGIIIYRKIVKTNL